MATNKVILNGETLIDLSQDTVQENKVLKGVTFHKADGNDGVGTLEISGDIPTVTETWVLTYEDGTTETKKVVTIQ
jgi:hypothetical protein